MGAFAACGNLHWQCRFPGPHQEVCLDVSQHTPPLGLSLAFQVKRINEQLSMDHGGVFTIGHERLLIDAFDQGAYLRNAPGG